MAREQLLADGGDHFHVHAVALQPRQHPHQVDGGTGALGDNIAVPGFVRREVPQQVEALGGGLEVRVREGRAVRHREVRARHFDDDHAHERLPGCDLRGREIPRRHVVVVPEAERDHLPAGKQLPHLRREDAEVRARVRRGFRPGVTGQDVQHAHAERAVLVLLAPHARRQIHERRERAVAAAHRPHAAVDVGVQGRALPHQADGGGGVAGFLNRGFQARSGLVRQRVVVAGQRALLHVDGAGEIRRQREKTVLGNVVQPLHHLGDGAPRAGDDAGLFEEFHRRRAATFGGDGLRRGGQVRHAQPLVLERIAVGGEPQQHVVRHLIANRHQPVGQPLAEAVLRQNRHHHVNVGLELPQPRGGVRHRAVADAVERHAEALLESLRQRHEIRRVHLHVVGMAGVPHHLVAVAGDGAVHGRRPPTFHRAPHHDHRPPVVRVPMLHAGERAENLLVVVAVRQRDHVPAIGGPLLGDAVALHGLRHHAADQRIVDAGVVEGEQHAQPLAHALRHRLGLELLGVPGGHGELALNGHHLGRRAGAHEIPKRGLAGGGGDADAGRPAVHVVDEVGGFRMSRQGADAAQLGLREQRIVLQAGVLQQRGQGAGAAPKAKAVYGQHGDARVHAKALVAGGRVPPRHRLAHDHPQRVERWDVVPSGQQ